MSPAARTSSWQHVRQLMIMLILLFKPRWKLKSIMHTRAEAL